MILAELTTQLRRYLQAAAANGDLPRSAAGLTAHGTWRPKVTAVTPVTAATPAAARAPGTYATSLPFQLAHLTGEPPVTAANRVAEALTGLPWISAVRPASGYLTITVTQACLAAAPARIIAAGPAVARSDALAGQELTAPRLPDLALEPVWPQAWRAQHRALLGRLAEAAGASVQYFEGERMPATPSGVWANERTPAAAMACLGADAVRYALARAASPVQSVIEAQLDRPLDVSNPFVLVRHAHADAASTLRWAAELELAPSCPPMPSRPAPVTAALRPGELGVIDHLSWFPERVASASRRRRPVDLTAYLETLAGAWIDCSKRYPALPFGGSGAPAEPAGDLARARYELAGAVRTIIAAGLDLLAVTAPVRI
ncbi:MAG TPA: DALR anticodon-binding domain-containing protein [Streptosporangiaceae bacterium]|nr:DALR anticodon-binding domain-containing protein [Streptosporangiaceae bacterium]